MSNYLSEDGTFINSLIGEGSLFEGSLNVNGLLRIDGDFKGNIKNSGKVLIGKSGRAEASVSAGTVVVGGILKGNINATEKIVILSTGLVIGNLSAPRLLVEEGVLINGKCTIGPVEPVAPVEREKTEETFQESKERVSRFFRPFKTSREEAPDPEAAASWKK